MKKESVPNKTNKKIVKSREWILAGGILAAALLVVLLQLFLSPKGEKAVISIDGTVIMEQPLSEDFQLPIQTLEGYNILEIRDGAAYVIEADCRDQICVEHPGISKKGETIVCLPHKLIVEIQTEKRVGGNK